MFKKTKMKLSKLVILATYISSSYSLAQDNVEDCMEITNDSLRLSCFDQVMQKNTSAEEVITSSPAQTAPSPRPSTPALRPNDSDTTQSNQTASNELRPASNTEREFGLEHKNNDPSRPETLNLTVSSASHNNFTGWTIEFQNGQTWKQVGTEKYRINKGEQYTIKRASFNSFLLGNSKNNRNIRIRRVE